MKKNHILLFLLFPILSFAQNYQEVESTEVIDGELMTVVRTAETQHRNSEQYNLFKTASRSSASKDYSAAVVDGVVFDFNARGVAKLQRDNPTHLTLELPFKNNGSTIKLDLVKINIHSPGFVAKTNTGRDITNEIDLGIHYKGTVSGRSNSLVGISVFNNEVMGFIDEGRNQYTLGRLSNSKSRHILYENSDLKTSYHLNCGMEDDDNPYRPEDLTYTQSRDVGDCVNIYVEAGQSVFNAFGGNLALTTNFLNGVFAQSFIVYANETITMQMSELFVWETPDPYTFGTPLAQLTEFQNQTVAINGDLGHLVEVQNIGGRAAGFSGICNSNVDNSLCHSGFSGTNFNNVPISSFNVYIITHEMGHLMGSRHTHACVWNGDNTAIDGCSGSVEGTCALPPSPPGGGTMMSYCINDPVGVNFAEGFHPQPQAVMLNTVANAMCLDNCAVCDLVVDCSNIFDQTLSCRADLPPVDFDLPIVTDSCGDVIQSALTIIPGNSGCPGDVLTVTRTYFLQDTDGNMAECMQTFTIVDNEVPNMLCQDITIQIDNSGMATIAPADVDGGSTNNCGSAMTLSLDITEFTCADIGDNTVTLTGEDVCGNTATCTATVTVQSMLTVDCSNITDETLSCRADLPPVDFDLPIIVNSCGDVTLSALTIIPGNSGCPGDEISITRTYFIQDEAGNREECMQTFTVVSNVLPTIVCPADMLVECAADIMVDAADAMATVECGTPMVAVSGPVVVGDPDCPGTTYTYTYTTTDDCGRTASCQQIFTIQNNGPMLTCPAPVTVACAADIVVDPSDVMVVTSCGLTYTAQVFGPNVYDGEPNCPGSRYVYRYLVEDECGRSAVCEREFIIDNAAPTVTCIGNQIVECEDDIILDPEQVITIVTSCDLEADIDVDGPNLVGGGAPSCNGTQYEVTYTITDPCGRTDQCTITWTLANSGPMIVTCAPDRVVECQADIASEPELLQVELACGTYQIFPSNIFPINVGATGNCPGDQWGITYQVFDVCGRSASCTQVWTIENEAPRVIPPEPITVACLDDVNPTIFDAEVETSCGLPIVRSEIFGPIYDETQPLCAGSIINYLYSFWDACGRMTCEAQTVTINPGATLSGMFDNVFVDCNDIPAVETTLEACGISYDLEVSEREIDDPGTSNSNYKLIRTYTAVDACGNIFEIEQTIQVRCDGPQSSSRSYCMLGDNGWSDMLNNPDDPIFEKINISKNNPFVIGEEGRAFIVDDVNCFMKMYSNSGSPKEFLTEMGEVRMSSEENCNFNYPNYIGEVIIENSLLRHLVSLALNMQVDPELAAIDLRNICGVLDEEMIDRFLIDPTVLGLYKSGESALLGYFDGEIYELDNMLTVVLDYFEACPALPCSEGRALSLFSDKDPSLNTSMLLEVFPNPALDNINYIVRDVKEEVTVRIYSTLGNLVYEKTYRDAVRENISLADFPSGVYQMILFEKDRVIESQKFIKQSY